MITFCWLVSVMTERQKNIIVLSRNQHLTFPVKNNKKQVSQMLAAYIRNLLFFINLLFYLTVTLTPFFTPFAATAYMVQVPFFLPLTTPFPDTDAMLLSEE